MPRSLPYLSTLVPDSNVAVALLLGDGHLGQLSRIEHLAGGVSVHVLGEWCEHLSWMMNAGSGS